MYSYNHVERAGRAFLSILFFIVLLVDSTVFAQDNRGGKLLPVIDIARGSTIHLVSPENIQYVDLSSHAMVGDLPVKNLLRIKILPDSLKNFSSFMNKDLAVLTIVGESYIAQYRIRYLPLAFDSQIENRINILPADTHPLDIPEISLSSAEMKTYSFNLLKKFVSNPVRKETAYGVQAKLNQLYTLGDHVFLDLSFINQTNLAYTIDELRFKIEDKKITKATNAQSIEVKPVWQLYPGTGFKKTYRNIYVLKKMTFPESKILNIELTEKQISGRTITLKVKYGDILKADTF